MTSSPGSVDSTGEPGTTWDVVLTPTLICRAAVELLFFTQWKASAGWNSSTITYIHCVILFSNEYHFFLAFVFMMLSKLLKHRNIIIIHYYYVVGYTCCGFYGKMCFEIRVSHWRCACSDLIAAHIFAVGSKQGICTVSAMHTWLSPEHRESIQVPAPCSKPGSHNTFF